MVEHVLKSRRWIGRACDIRHRAVGARDSGAEVVPQHRRNRRFWRGRGKQRPRHAGRVVRHLWRAGCLLLPRPSRRLFVLDETDQLLLSLTDFQPVVGRRAGGRNTEEPDVGRKCRWRRSALVTAPRSLVTRHCRCSSDSVTTNAGHQFIYSLSIYYIYIYKFWNLAFLDWDLFEPADGTFSGEALAAGPLPCGLARAMGLPPAGSSLLKTQYSPMPTCFGQCCHRPRRARLPATARATWANEPLSRELAFHRR